MDIFNKTPQVLEADNHTSKSLQIKVWGVLEPFYIDLFIPINFIICNLSHHWEIWAQSLIKFQFQFFWKMKRNSFPGITWFYSAKAVFFPVFMIYNILWGKKLLLKNHLKSANENCSVFPLFFFTFWTPLMVWLMPYKFSESAWIFLCDFRISFAKKEKKCIL